MDVLNMNWDGMVRRADLNLRAAHVDLDTTIYKLDKAPYQIHVQRIDPIFTEIQIEFNNKIRHIMCPVNLVNVRPIEFTCILPQINDAQIPHNFEGIDFDSDTLLDLLTLKFPKINFYKIRHHVISTDVHIYLLEETTDNSRTISLLSNTDRKQIQEFLNNLKLPYHFNLLEDQVKVKPIMEVPQLQNPVLDLINEKLPGKPSSDFIKRDEALWFDNIDAIYEGRFKKSDLYFLNEAKYACYADLSVFGNIDIRNFLFLYQTIYIALPIEKDLAGWLIGQKIEEAEFAELISRNRIKIVLLQPKWRYYDLGFLQQLYLINHSSIISRRALATLQQIDLVQMSDNYLFSDPQLLTELKVFCEAVASVLHIDAKQYYQLLTWPLRAKRASFTTLNQRGIMSMGGIGINTVLDKLIGDKLGKDLSFDFTVNASNIHFAHALNATYFPYFDANGYTDSFYANVIGDFLNLVTFSKKDNIKQLAEMTKAPGRRTAAINPIEVIEISDFASILELDNVLTAANAFPKSQYLMNYLASLDPEKRKSTIKWYNKKVADTLGKKSGRKNLIDLGVNTAIDTLGLVTGAAFLGTGLELIKAGQKLTKSFKSFESIKAKIDEAYADDIDAENIHYLAQINRVAKVKRFS